MAMDYGLDDGFGFAPENAAQMGGVLMAKITVETTETPGDYSGVPVTNVVTEKIPIPMAGPAPMMMPGAPPAMPMMDPSLGMGAPAIPPPGMALPHPMPAGAPMPGQMPMPMPMPGPGAGPGPGPGPGSGSMGAQAAQQVMQQFGAM
jgi:hypothetical protein